MKTKIIMLLVAAVVVYGTGAYLFDVFPRLPFGEQLEVVYPWDERVHGSFSCHGTDHTYDCQIFINDPGFKCNAYRNAVELKGIKSGSVPPALKDDIIHDKIRSVHVYNEWDADVGWIYVGSDDLQINIPVNCEGLPAGMNYDSQPFILYADFTIFAEKPDPGQPVCGNGICESSETQDNCHDDCGYPKPEPYDFPWIIPIAVVSLVVVGLAGRKYL